MAPQDPSTLPPVVTGVVPNPAVNLGKNFSVTNSAVGVKTALPITTSTVITAQGLNINPLAGGKSKLTISDSGDINSAGALSFGNGNFTVSSLGAVVSAGGFSTANSKFSVDPVTGRVTATGGFSFSDSNFTVDNASGNVATAGDFAVATDKFTVTAATGAVAAAGDFAVATDKFKVTAATGAVAAKGDLNINDNKFIVAASSGDVTAAGNLSIAKSFAVNTNRFNVQTDGSLSINTSKFTVDSASGNVLAAGEVAVTGDLKINTNKFTVSSLNGDVYTVGKITAANNLTINTDSIDKFTVTAATGAVAALGDLAINSDKFKVTASTGAVAAKGDLTINTNKFSVTASSGDVVAAGSLSAASASISGGLSAASATIAGSLAINTNKFTVSSAGVVAAAGSLSTAGSLSATGDFAVNTNKFTVASSSGNVAAAGSLSAASASVTGALSATSLAINDSKFTVSSNGNLAVNSNKFTVSPTGAVVAAGAASIAGDLTIATDKLIVSSTDGKVTSAIPYASYTPAACATNTTTTSASGVEPVMTSATSTYLTTQEYVDKQLWNQTKRINTILGSDDMVNNFNNVYKLVDAFAGHADTVTALNSINGNQNALIDKTAEIVTSVSDVVAQAYNTVLVNCTPAVWMDECGPVPIPSSITLQTIEDGWYFKNYVLGNKINWRVPINGADMTVGDIKNLYMNIFAASNVNLPFITVYTAPKGNADDYAVWAGARINYYFNASSPAQDANKSYCLYTGKAPMNVYGKTTLSPSSVLTTNKLNGALQDTSSTTYSSAVSSADKVIGIVIQSASTSLANQTNFVLNSLNVCLKTGTTNFAFSNAGVTSNYLFNYFFTKNVDFSAFPSPAKQGPYVEQFNTAENSA
jgi:hypothetical protein